MIIMILSVLLTCLAGCGSTSSENPADLSETVTASPEGNTALKEFTAETLDGSEFSPETLAAADLTVLNIWQTTCPPCIREMPELAELERELPDRVRFVTWCLDGAYAAEETRSILSEAGLEEPPSSPATETSWSFCQRCSTLPPRCLSTGREISSGNQ
jgi:hypothetical protein